MIVEEREDYIGRQVKSDDSLNEVNFHNSFLSSVLGHVGFFEIF